jgi:hypothetical protein
MANECRASYGMRLKFGARFRHTVAVMINNPYVAIVLLALMADTLFADASKTRALLMAMGANSKQMISYKWKQKVTVIRKGKPMEPMLEELRFDATGQLQRMTLVKPEEKRMGPLRARKAAETKESVQEVMQLARQYSNPQQLTQAIQKGEIWEGQGTLRVQARSVVLPVDEMMISVNSASYLATRIDFQTQHEGSPVAIAIDYQQLPNGPSMMTRMTVQIPKEDIVVNVESFDFIRLAGPNFHQL